MPVFTRIEVVSEMKKSGLVPLFYNDDVETSLKIIESLYKGGARVVEFTSRGDFAYQVFEALIKKAKSDFPQLILGVGSVTDAAAASLYMQMGANFIVTPVFREDVARVCNRRKIAWFPGCGSLNEIAIAEELGCDIVKLFPGDIYGPEFVKSIRGPQPWTNIMPTGGVTTEADNLKSWFEAGAFCVGIGSKLISKDILQNKDYSGLKNRVVETLKRIKDLRA